MLGLNNGPASVGFWGYHWHQLFFFLCLLSLLHAVWWSTHPQCMTPAFGLKHTSVCISVPSLLPFFACSVVVYTSPVYDPGLRVKTHFHLYLRSQSLTLFACSVVVYTSPVYDPGLRVKTHFRSSPLCLAICSNVMTLKITLRPWLTDN